MSRLARRPIIIPQGVNVTLNDTVVSVVKGQKVSEYNVPKSIKVNLVGNEISCVLVSQNKNDKPMLGTAHVTINNMIKGMVEEFTVELQLFGVGYNVTQEGNTLVFNLGKSHADRFDIPSDVVVSIPEKGLIKLTSNSKHVVTHVADRIVKLRSPDAYKAKGIRYKGRDYKLKEVEK